MFIGEEKIGLGNKCFMIAEVGQAHDGSLGMAHAYMYLDTSKLRSLGFEAKVVVEEMIRSILE